MALAAALASAIAAIVAFSFVALLAFVGGWRQNRLLILILALEALLQGVIAGGEFIGDNPAGERLFFLVIVLLGLFAWSYLVFLGRVDSPIVGWTRSKLARSITAVVAIGAGLALDARVAIAQARGPYDANGDPFVGVMILVVFASIAIVGILALAGTIDAWRRSPRGTSRRARAGAFAIAFGTRDFIMVGGLLLSEFTPPAAPFSGIAAIISDYSFAVATIVYVPLLAYGILKTQLFDLDLRVKVGIRRSTIVTVILIFALAAAKTAEYYLNKTYGYIAGGIAAGVMLFLAPRLNKMGEKVANVAMPQVQPTPAYLAAKKLDVYRTAVETAIETGGIDARQRLTLDRLRTKLGLVDVDCAAVEAEVNAS